MDHPIERGGKSYAGAHQIIDMWAPKRIDDLKFVEAALRKSVAAAGATLLHIHLHHFTVNDGVSGVAVLAESHISLHTWPERGFAAFDIFMCGACAPYHALPVLRRHLAPATVQLSETKRGLVG